MLTGTRTCSHDCQLHFTCTTNAQLIKATFVLNNSELKIRVFKNMFDTNYTKHFTLLIHWLVVKYLPLLTEIDNSFHIKVIITIASLCAWVSRSTQRCDFCCSCCSGKVNSSKVTFMKIELRSQISMNVASLSVTGETGEI